MFIELGLINLLASNYRPKPIDLTYRRVSSIAYSFIFKYNQYECFCPTPYKHLIVYIRPAGYGTISFDTLDFYIGIRLHA